jgi:hypothetical protein
MPTNTYVLATKYSDGDPRDHFCVGFIESYLPNGRYIVVDNYGESYRASGFRRAEKITKEEGDALVAIFNDISDQHGPSLWSHLLRIKRELKLANK